MKESKIAVIVDPYSSGALYASEFAKHGVFCIAIQSSLPVPAHFLQDFDPLNFIEILPPSPSHELASRLSARNVVAVVAGCDTAIAMTDELSNELGLSFRNDPATSAIRRYKDQMHEALKACGLRHIETTAFKSFKEFSTRSNEFDVATAFVVKPINSAGSEGVCFAQGSQGVAEALKVAAWEQENVLGEINSGFAVQRFIPGYEYVVDMVASGKDVFIAAVCRVHKVNMNGSRFVCESVDLLDPQDAELGNLTEYAQQAARGLGAISGPVHMELISGTDGSFMIEANCRLPGAGLPSLYAAVYNPDLLSATVCAYLGKPIASVSTNEPASTAKRERLGRAVCLISEAKREFIGFDEDDEKRLRMLKSYRGHKLYIKKGDILGKTIDFATCPGVIFLAHKSLRRLDDDEEMVRSIFSRYLTI
jgi:predicted ATP-grasp superfamily ATP-dependent carboligase